VTATNPAPMMRMDVSTAWQNRSSTRASSSTAQARIFSATLERLVRAPRSKHGRCTLVEMGMRAFFGAGEPSPGADVAEVSPVLVQMWKG
jgi:hypothetical protein